MAVVAVRHVHVIVGEVVQLDLWREESVAPLELAEDGARRGRVGAAIEMNTSTNTSNEYGFYPSLDVWGAGDLAVGLEEVDDPAEGGAHLVDVLAPRLARFVPQAAVAQGGVVTQREFGAVPRTPVSAALPPTEHRLLALTPSVGVTGEGSIHYRSRN